VKTADAKRCPSTPAPSSFPESVTSNHTSEAYYAVWLYSDNVTLLIVVGSNFFGVVSLIHTFHMRRNTLRYYALQDALYRVEMWSVNLVFAKKRLEFLGAGDQSPSQILSNFLSRSFQ
jgi:hypothetical protein